RFDYLVLERPSLIAVEWMTFVFLIRKPSSTAIEAFIAARDRDELSYLHMGATSSKLPDGYTIDHHCISTGRGFAEFERAKGALRSWQMFKLDWLEIFPHNAPITPGTTVASLIKHFGFWSLNACRIVYAIEEPRRFAFAYGTLPDHAEQGEERFSV